MALGLFQRILLWSCAVASAVASFAVAPVFCPPHHLDGSRRRRSPSPPDAAGSSSLSNRQHQRQRQDYASTTSTSLNVLLDVPDRYFFTITFPVLGLLLSISRNYARARLEEAAWEQRLEEGREGLLRRDPALTELDLRRREAAREWSAYGAPRREEEAAAAAERRRKRAQEEREGATVMGGGGRRRRVRVLDRDDDDNDDIDSRDYRMTDAEIEAFESEFGVAYDPYYDDPYSLEELPDGKYDVDRLYGDRIYDNGEIFYKDSKSGLFYRQGSKPRNLSFF